MTTTMSNEETFAKLRSLISKQLGVDETEIKPNSHLNEDLNADPLSIADLLVGIEEEFQVKIPSDQTANLETVRDLLNYISDQKGDI